MTGTVRRRPVTTQILIRSQFISCGVCSVKSGPAVGFSPSNSIFMS